MKTLSLLFIFMFVSGCAAVPFKKTDSGHGYQVINGKHPDNFTVKFNLPENMHTRSLDRYYARAVGEECLERGYSHFLNSSTKDGETTGFCYKSNVRKGLGPSYSRANYMAVPPKFIIENLNSKSRTNLKINDEVLLVEKQKATSMAHFHQIMFDISKRQPLPSEVSVVIKRDGKEVSLKEPLADMPESSFGPDDLMELRQTVN